MGMKMAAYTLAVAVVIYALATLSGRGLRLHVKRPEGFDVIGYLVGTGTVFFGSVIGLFSGALSEIELLRWLGPVVGGILALLLALQLATPKCASVVIHLNADSEFEKQLKARHRPPYLWPYELAVAKGGCVVWSVPAAPTFPDGTEIEIEFLGGRGPFDCQTVRRPLTERIVVAPVVRSGEGQYRVRFIDPEGTVLEGDPIWKIPPYP